MYQIIQKAGFLLRNKYPLRFFSFFRKNWFTLLGMKVGKRTSLPKMFVTWPHKVSIGEHCRLEHGIYFKFDGIWSKGHAIVIGNNVFIGANSEFNINTSITIGHDCLIASGCRFIDHNHGMQVGTIMRKQRGDRGAIVIGNDVWLGVNVTILKGVTIGDGAIVAAGAVVNKNILANEIWGGLPAKKIGERVRV